MAFVIGGIPLLLGPVLRGLTVYVSSVILNLTSIFETYCLSQNTLTEEGEVHEKRKEKKGKQ